MSASVYSKVKDVYDKIIGKITACAGRKEIAAEFDSETTYGPGQMTVHNNVLYRCTGTYKGDWDESHFLPTTVDEAIRALLNIG